MNTKKTLLGILSIFSLALIVMVSSYTPETAQDDETSYAPLIEKSKAQREDQLRRKKT